MTESSRTVLVGALLWLLAAIALGAAGALLGLRPFVLVLLVASLAVVLMLAGWLVPGLQRFAEGADLRLLAGVHLARLVGLHFVILGARGLLPSLLVLAAGFGNLLVGVLAGVLIALVPPGRPTGRAWWIAWNVLGLVVGLSVGVSILVLGRTDPDALRALRVLPLSLVPSFVAPIALATHAWMLVRLSRGR